MGLCQRWGVLGRTFVPSFSLRRGVSVAGGARWGRARCGAGCRTDVGTTRMSTQPARQERATDLRRFEPRHLDPIPEPEALALLGGVDFGRLVFTEHALPAVRPLNHILEGGDVIIRTRLGSAAATTAVPPVLDVVTYQADRIDPDDRTGWSVVVTGRASVVTDPDRQRRCAELLHPWVELPMDLTLAIAAEIVRGFRLVPTAQPLRPGH